MSTFHFIIVFILVLIFLDNRDLRKKIKCVENFTASDLVTLDSAAMANFISLAKGGAVNISSLNLTGNLAVAGNTTTNGELTVVGKTTVNGPFIATNGSNFSGGNSYFQNGTGRVRIGEVQGFPGIFAEDNKPLILGSSGNQINFRKNDSTDMGYVQAGCTTIVGNLTASADVYASGKKVIYEDTAINLKPSNDSGKFLNYFGGYKAEFWPRNNAGANSSNLRIKYD